jgi:hypothetical protein
MIRTKNEISAAETFPAPVSSLPKSYAQAGDFCSFRFVCHDTGAISADSIETEGGSV